MTDASDRDAQAIFIPYESEENVSPNLPKKSIIKFDDSLTLLWVYFNNYFCFTETKARCSLQKDQIRGKRSKCALTSDQVEILIAEVEKREALRNFRRNPSEREKHLVLRLWEEVAACDELNGIYFTLFIYIVTGRNLSLLQFYYLLDLTLPVSSDNADPYRSATTDSVVVKFLKGE